MLHYFLQLIVFSLLVSNPFASADIHKLLESRHRPSIADIKRELNGKKGYKYPSNPTLTFEQFKDSIEQAAIIIAELEWAYPGAIYMPLGRDSVWVGDIIDAFYQTYGQTGRVKRLNASSQSLRVPQELIAKWVQSSGVDIKNLSKGPSYIIIDGSNYHLPTGSQSTKILTAVYSAYTAQGGQAKDIIKKFAFFNLSGHASSANVQTKASVDRDRFFLIQNEYLTIYPMGIPNKIFASTRRAFIYYEWHEQFGVLTEMPDGSVVAPPPSEPTTLLHRKNIIRIMSVIMDLVAAPEFLEMVKARAKELGYEFKIRGQTCDDSLKAVERSKVI